MSPVTFHFLKMAQQHVACNDVGNSFPTRVSKGEKSRTMEYPTFGHKLMENNKNRDCRINRMMSSIKLNIFTSPSLLSKTVAWKSRMTYIQCI